MGGISNESTCDWFRSPVRSSVRRGSSPGAAGRARRGRQQRLSRAVVLNAKQQRPAEAETSIPTQLDRQQSDRIGCRDAPTPSGIPIEGTDDPLLVGIPRKSRHSAVTAACGTVGGGRHGRAGTCGRHRGAAERRPEREVVGTGAIFAQPPAGVQPARAVRWKTSNRLRLRRTSCLDPVIGGFGRAVPHADLLPLVGGTPPTSSFDEVSGAASRTLSQHCAPGCTANGGVLCVGSECQRDIDCGRLADGTCIRPDLALSRQLSGTNGAAALAARRRLQRRLARPRSTFCATTPNRFSHRRQAVGRRVELTRHDDHGGTR